MMGFFMIMFLLNSQGELLDNLRATLDSRSPLSIEAAG